MLGVGIRGYIDAPGVVVVCWVGYRALAHGRVEFIDALAVRRAGVFEPWPVA